MKVDLSLELAHLNVRREREGDQQGSVAADLKLVGEAPISKLRGLFATDAAYNTLLKGLYQENGELICGDLDTMRLKTEAHDVHASLDAPNNLKDSQVVFKNAQLNKITIAPKSGKVAAISMRLQVKPGEHQLEPLSNLLMEVIGLSISSMQMELQTDDEEEEEEEESDGKKKAA